MTKRILPILLCLSLLSALLTVFLYRDSRAQVSAGFSCVVSGATADTVCQAAPGAGLRFYVTDVVVSNAGTAQTVRIVTGTGTTCGTGTAVVVPLLNLAINDSVPMHFKTPIKAAVNADLCSDISGITAHSVLIIGIIAP